MGIWGGGRAGYVYFVRSPSNGRIKIGYVQSNPNARFLSLRSGSPVEIERLALMHGGMADEHALHARFAALRWRGEWFEGGEGLLAFIRENGRGWDDLLREDRKKEREASEERAVERAREFREAYRKQWERTSTMYMLGLDPDDPD